MTAVPPPKIDFATALMKERGRYKIPRAELGRHVGVAEAVIKRWERGDAIPSREQFKRLCTRLPRMAPFFPQWDALAVNVVTGIAEEDREYNAREVSKMIPIIDKIENVDPDDFGVGLRRIREENGVTQAELAELLGVTTPAVTQWEADDTSPVIPNLDKLFEVLPELKAGIEARAIRRPQSQQRDVPNGGRGYPRSTTVDTMLDMALENSDKVAALPKPERPRHEPFVGAWLGNDQEGRHHDHVPAESTEDGRRITVCALCGARMPEESKMVANDQAQDHSNDRKRCPCGGKVRWHGGALGDTWFCEACQAKLMGCDLVEPKSNTIELAEAYVKARIAAAKAKAAENAAYEVWVNAQTVRKNAEQEAGDAEALLELAIQEESK